MYILCIVWKLNSSKLHVQQKPDHHVPQFVIGDHMFEHTVVTCSSVVIVTMCDIKWVLFHIQNLKKLITINKFHYYLFPYCPTMLSA